jgi:hypothetical protein
MLPVNDTALEGAMESALAIRCPGSFAELETVG